MILGLAALAAIALMVARPARVVGVDDAALASSLRQQVDAGTARCEAAHDEGGEKTAWRCALARITIGGGGDEASGTYVVEATEWGCWAATRTGVGAPGLPRKLSACIWLADYVRVLD